MSARDAILAKIRNATAGIPSKPDYPDYSSGLLHSKPRLAGDSLVETFSRNFSGINGKVFDSPSALAGFLLSSNQSRGYCDPSLMPVLGQPLADAGLAVETVYDRDRYEDYRFGITRATAAIAESGTLVLDDLRTTDRLAALSPWVHIAVIRRRDVLATIPDAIAAFDDSPNILWATGPSKTADVEGILIEGVHGPGEQIAYFVD